MPPERSGTPSVVSERGSMVATDLLNLDKPRPVKGAPVTDGASAILVGHNSTPGGPLTCRAGSGSSPEVGARAYCSHVTLSFYCLTAREDGKCPVGFGETLPGANLRHRTQEAEGATTAQSRGKRRFKSARCRQPERAKNSRLLRVGDRGGVRSSVCQNRKEEVLPVKK